MRATATLSGLLHSLLGRLVAEHRCFPPDRREDWEIVPARLAREPKGEIYACPECGRQMARRERMLPAA